MGGFYNRPAMNDSLRYRRGRGGIVWCGLAALLGATALAGCEFKNAEFVMRDRPSSTVMRGDEAVPYYVVHIGDTPSLAFRSKLYFCNYAIMHDSTTDGFEDCGPDLGGAFEWPYRFDEVSPPGAFTTLSVKAYTANGKRDFMPYRGKIMELEIGNDPEDEVAAEAEMLVRVYQSRVEIPVDLGGKEALWHAARLEMDGQGVRKRRILHSGSPRAGHFSVEGPDGVGRYRVIYEPTIKDIDPTGVTKAVLTVPDEDAQLHEFSVELRPPSMGPESLPMEGGAPDDGMTPMSIMSDSPIQGGCRLAWVGRFSARCIREGLGAARARVVGWA